MAHKTEAQASDVNVPRVRISDYIGDHIVKFVETYDAVGQTDGSPFTAAVFKVVKSSSPNLASDEEVTHAIFGVNRYGGKYYKMEMRELAAAVAGLDICDSDVPWEDIFEELDGPDNKHKGTLIQLTCFQVPDRKNPDKKYSRVRYKAAPKR